MPIDPSDERYNDTQIIDPLYDSTNINYDTDERDNDFDKIEKFTKIINMIVPATIIMFVIIFIFSTLILFSFVSINIESNSVTISPNYDYYDTDTEYLREPCIYNDQNNYTTRPVCNKNYNLIDIADICDQNIQKSSYICMFNQIGPNNIYFPNCTSVTNINKLYSVGLIVNDSVVIGENYYENNLIITSIISLIPILTILCFFCYARYVYNIKINSDNLHYHLYGNYFLYILLVLIVIIFSYVPILIIISPSIQFISELVSIDCSGVNIFNSSNFVQKMFVSQILGKDNDNVIFNKYIIYYEYIKDIVILIDITIILIIIYLTIKLIRITLK